MPAPLELLLDFLRFPSISTDSAHAQDVQNCAEWLAQQCREAGLSASLHPTKRHPVVLAKNAHRPGRPHVLIYGHYDVQPVDDPMNVWRSKPFDPQIENGIIYARGATDNKGQLMAHLCGVAATMRQHADLPVNLTFLFEGEEEIGSPNLAAFLEAHRAELTCDIIAISDTGMVAPNVPTFTYGLRGIACFEVVLRGPSIDLHSGIFGGAVANPSTMLARLVATLHDAEGRVAIEGFYDKVRPIQQWERDAWAKLCNEEETLDLTGAPALFGETGYTDAERRWARPTAEVNGIGGGYQGEGSKTVIGTSAFAKLSFRLVPDQDPEEIQELVKAHLRRHLPPAVALEIKEGHCGKPYAMDPHSRFGKAAQAALAKTFSQPLALIREGGSIPIVQSFRDILGVETLLLGLALPDCQAHAPNENFPIANFEGGQQLNQHLLEALARA
jgi:acetylornithine deacetylase/succinyl-diaminopimelate desuccinylase-like protein